MDNGSYNYQLSPDWLQKQGLQHFVYSIFPLSSLCPYILNKVW